MKKSLFYLFAILFMAGTVTACSSSDNDKDENSLKVSAATLFFYPKAEEQTFDITSNVEWAVNSDQEWCVVTPDLGENDKKVTVKVTENTGVTERIARISIESKGVATKVVKVTQNGLVDGPIVGEWKLDGMFDEEDSVEKSPIELVIVRKAGVEDKDFSIMGGMMTGELAMGMGAQIAGGLVMKVLEEIIFQDDSNIIAKYKEMDGKEPTGEWLTSPEGLASYQLRGNNGLSLRLNADAIIKEAKIENEKIASIVKEFLKDEFALACSFNDGMSKLKISMDLLDITNKNINRAFEELLALPDEVLDGMGSRDFLEALSKELPVMFNNASKFEASILLKK